MDTERLPFDLTSHQQKTIDSIGTKVYLPDSKKGQVIKVSRISSPYTNLATALERVKEYRQREIVATEEAGFITKNAIVPQAYVLAEGETPGTSRIVRTQEYIEGQPLKCLGFGGVMNLSVKQIDTLRAIIADSMKCYLKHGINYDLIGSDERDAIKKSRILNIKRIIFPLRNSNNLFATKDEIKLVDPNIYGKLAKKDTLKAIIIQGLLFLSSAADYFILTGRKLTLKKSSKIFRGSVLYKKFNLFFLTIFHLSHKFFQICLFSYLVIIKLSNSTSHP